MAYQKNTCLRFIDDYPGQRALCADNRRRGLRCTHCPEHPDSPEVAIEQADQWRLAVDQLLSGWYSTADSYATPHEALKALIAFEVAAALDPSVSSDAEALVERGRREVLDEVLRGLRSERDTTQLRAIIASVEYIRARGEGPTWTEEQVGQVDTEADRLVGKFSRGEGK